MKKPSHVLSPRPAAPTLFMPSFQSPVPKSGSPWAPAVRPLSIARTQCSKSVPASVETPGWPYDSCSALASSGAVRNGTRSSRTAASPVARTYSATT